MKTVFLIFAILGCALAAKKNVYEQIMRQVAEQVIQLWPDPTDIIPANYDFSFDEFVIKLDTRDGGFNYFTGFRLIEIGEVDVHETTGAFTIQLTAPYLAIICDHAEMFVNSSIIYPEPIEASGHFNMIAAEFEGELTGFLRLLPIGIDGVDYSYSVTNTSIIMGDLEFEVIQHLNDRGPEILAGIDAVHHQFTAFIFQYLLNQIIGEISGNPIFEQLLSSQ